MYVYIHVGEMNVILTQQYKHVNLHVHTDPIALIWVLIHMYIHVATCIFFIGD